MSKPWYSPRKFSPRRSQQSPLRSQNADSPPSPPSQPSQQSESRSKRENSPGSRLSSLSARLRGRTARTNLPRPPLLEAQAEVAAPRRSGITKRGAVTVRFGEVHREPPSDYRVEAYIDDCHIGSTPPCSCYDPQPMWDFTMRMCDLELGADLILRIVCKKGGWHHKDVEVARGVLPLDNDSFARNYVEEDVDIFFPSEVGPPERLGDEHMAEIRVHIDFDVPAANIQKREPKPAKPILLHDSGENGWESQSIGSRPSKNSGLRKMVTEEESERGDVQPTILLRDTGAGVALPRSTFKRQQIVDQHYWDTVPIASSTVLCTPMIIKLLRLEKWVPCWPRHLRKEDDDEDV